MCLVKKCCNSRRQNAILGTHIKDSQLVKYLKSDCSIRVFCDSELKTKHLESLKCSLKCLLADSSEPILKPVKEFEDT